ncbi:MAG: AAA family ATPase [Alphaproteobacteria bacterium]|nr:AAA family ATPase [Alphaproteobacteria bacterium]
MIFRRKKAEDKAKKPDAEAAGKAGEEGADATGAGVDHEAVIAAKGVEALEAGELRKVADPQALGFSTTEEIEPSQALIGQARALAAINFGAGMKSNDFNIFVLGSDASGKIAAARDALKKLAQTEPQPDDWVYVQNFDEPNAPKALHLPAGRGRQLEKAMIEVVDELSAAIPTAFEGEDYQARSRAIEADYSSRNEERLQALGQKAEANSIALLRTPMGFTFAPMLEGKVVKPDAFAAMPPSMQEDVRKNIEGLQEELTQILADVPRVDKERRNRLRELNEEVAADVVNAAMSDALAEFADCDGALTFLKRVTADLIANAHLFLSDAGSEPSSAGSVTLQSPDVSRDPRFRRYMVNPIISQPAELEGAPVVEEANPTLGNVIGRAEHLAQMGTLVTDFLLIKPGALHKANGGYLLVDARKLLLSAFAWEALKRALQTETIRIEQPGESLGLMTTQTIDPEPIPLNVKIVLFGDRQLYYLLSKGDPEFQHLFKVQADFEDRIERNDDNTNQYARLIASLIGEHQLQPFTADAVAGIVEQSSRIAGDRAKLSLEVSRIGDIVREADYWSKQSGNEATTREDVRRAVAEHSQRGDRIRDRDQETFEQGVVLVDTDGEKVGQINGLSVLQLGEFTFGRPSRITARVRFGPGRIVDIEREAKLGGPLHSKGVMILWGYLAGQFAQDRPLALSASLVFEQSYGGVDGDSASSTELYALLSALAGTPIKQGIAVTGSVNQLGEVQAIGGVNEKIEGFFDVCTARGLTGEQGVVIPKANVQHLMLREDVVEAVKEGRFSVWAVANIGEGIEILTGVAAGERKREGVGGFPEGTVFARVERTLELFADRARAAGVSVGGVTGGNSVGAPDASGRILS